MYIHLDVPVLSTESLGDSDTSVAMSTPSFQILVSKYSPIKTSVPWTDCRAGAGKNKMNLEHLSVSESKKVLKSDGNLLQKHGNQVEVAKPGTI